MLIHFCFSLVNLCFLTRPHLTTQKDRGKMVSLPLVDGSWALGRWWGLEEVTRVGLTCPEGIVALIEDCQKTSFLSLHPLRVPWEVGCLQAGRGPSSGNRIGQPLTWDFLASRTVRSSCAHYFVLAAPGWLRQTWCLLISLIMGFVLYFHLDQWSSLWSIFVVTTWSPHDRPSYQEQGLSPECLMLIKTSNGDTRSNHSRRNLNCPDKIDLN